MKHQILFLALALLIHLASSQATCGPRVRRSWRSLSPQEQQTFVDAVLALKTSGVYDSIVVQHYSSRNTDVAHGTSAFLPWHRWYLWQYESALRSLGGRFACITVPYWDWERDASNVRSASILGSLMGTLTPSNDLDVGSCVRDGAFRNWVATNGDCLRRVWDNSVSLVGEVGVMQALTNARYGDDNRNQGFRFAMENRLHAAPHVWIGGHMGTFESPNDPLFFLHHSNVDRLWAIWQDCHDYDQLNYDSFSAGSYAWYTPSFNTDTLLSQLPYRFDNGTADPRFLVNGRFPTPRDMMVYQKNQRVGMDYSYEPNDNMVQLMNERFGRCRWHVFGTNPGAQTPPAQNPPAQNPPAQTPPAQNPPAQTLPGQTRPSSSRPTRPSSARPTRPSTARPTRPQSSARPTRPNRQTTSRPNGQNGQNSHQGGRGFGNRLNGQQGGQQQNDQQTGQQNRRGGATSILQNILGIFRGRQKRDIEQLDNATTAAPRPRAYGVVAENLINQVTKKFKVSHPRVQELIESICDSNPITKAAPAVDRIWMVALGECEILETEKHVTNKWIKMMHMQNRTEELKPICPPRSCCKAADMVSPNMLCSGGGVAKPICNTNTCQWSYDCGNKTVLSKEILAEITLNDAARATEESAAYFLFDSQATGSGVSPMLALGVAVVTLPFIALAIIVVVLYKMRQNAADY